MLVYATFAGHTIDKHIAFEESVSIKTTNYHNGTVCREIAMLS